MVREENKVKLADLTTVHLGGVAESVFTCTTDKEIKEALKIIQSKGMSLHILGGGSNTIFSDEGFAGAVLRIKTTGVSFEKRGKYTYVLAAAGEEWDGFVFQMVKRGLAGVECMSGIPGYVGATPIQNVGAYGQEVASVIEEVRVIDQNTGEDQVFSAEECQFSYRSSRFKTTNKNRYIIASVLFRLDHTGTSQVKYPQLQELLTEKYGSYSIGSGAKALEEIRDTVIELRRKKSMVVSSDDPNSRSCGSFFLNPVIDKEKVQGIERVAGVDVPHFPFGGQYKVPAAWLVEHAGFERGYREGGVGISPNHFLALVNYGGTTKGILSLAQSIQQKVKEQFDIQLEREPVAVSYQPPVQ